MLNLILHSECYILILCNKRSFLYDYIKRKSWYKNHKIIGFSTLENNTVLRKSNKKYMLQMQNCFPENGSKPTLPSVESLPQIIPAHIISLLIGQKGSVLPL